MSAEPDPADLVRELWDHPHTGTLANAVRHWSNGLWKLRRNAPLEAVSLPIDLLQPSQAETPHGNLQNILDRGPQGSRERALVGALLALSLRERPPGSDAEADDVGCSLVWLAARTGCDALPALDSALGEQAGPIWHGVARVLLMPSSLPDFGTAEALVAAAALQHSPAPEAHRLSLEARGLALDPAVQALLAPVTSFDDELRGELAPARSPWLTVLMAVTLVLFVVSGARLFARYALLYRRPATLRLGPQGLELSSQTLLLGKVLRNRSLRIPMSGIASLTREVRYSGLALYAGLLALAIGTYYGTGLLVDFRRVREIDPLAVGVLSIILGLSLDFLLTSLSHSVRGRCRVLIVPLRGRPFCVGSLDVHRADALLAAVAAQTRRAVAVETPAPATPAPAEPATT
jgi:hypothetical protein